MDCQNVGRMVNVPTPLLAGDGASKGYVDSVAQGLAIHASVRVATVAEVDIHDPPSTLDDIPLALDDRMLVKDQTLEAENGVYRYTGPGVTLMRVDDLLTGAHAAHVFVYVCAGTAHAKQGWVCLAPETVDLVGTDPLPWTQFSAAGQNTPGVALEAVGNVWNVRIDNASVVLSGGVLSVAMPARFASHKATFTIGDGAARSFTLAHNLGTTAVLVSVRSVLVGDQVQAAVDVLDTMNVRVSFSAVPSTGEFEVAVIG
jgi:hypothetical protein